MSTGDNPHPDQPTDSILVKCLRELFTAEQWDALMRNVSFQRFIQNCTEKDQELVVAYALEVLRKRPLDEQPTVPENPK